MRVGLFQLKIKMFTNIRFMANTYKHKIIGKLKNKIDIKTPINILKYFNRINFDKGRFLNKRNIIKNKILKDDFKRQY